MPPSVLQDLGCRAWSGFPVTLFKADLSLDLDGLCCNLLCDVRSTCVVGVIESLLGGTGDL